MALDIHISKSKDKAALLERVLFFDEDLHDFVFKQGSIFESYPQFLRLSDYYTDTVYTGIQIEELKKELKKIISLTKYDPLALFSVSFMKVCEKAINKDANIYCFAD